MGATPQLPAFKSEFKFEPNSKYNKPAPINTLPQNFDLGDIQYADAHGFFDIRSPSLSSPSMQNFPPQVTPSKSTFDNSPQLPENFPLADLSAMMFPNPDPLAYPNQAGPNSDLNYESLFKNMTSANPSCSAMFPTPSLPQSSSDSAGFMPPSSTFMYGTSSNTNQPFSQDGDVPLLGPMPMYMMQGQPQSDQPDPAPSAVAQQQQAQQAIRNKYFPSGPSANMNLDALLGNEEWAGLPAGRAPVAGFVGTGVASTDGAFRSKNPQTQGNEQGVQFEDLTPGMLGWGLEGF